MLLDRHQTHRHPEGQVEFLGGLSTYISEPSGGPVSGTHKKVLLEVTCAAGKDLSVVQRERAEATACRGETKSTMFLLFLSHIFVPVFIKNKLLQDYFTACGFIVPGPDYFFGTYAQDLLEDQDKTAWAYEALSKALEAFPNWLDAVKAKYGTETTKCIAVGYCFGASFVLDLAAEESIAAGAVVRAAFLKEHRFERMKPQLYRIYQLFRMPSEEFGGIGNFWYSFDYSLARLIVLSIETEFPIGLVVGGVDAGADSGPCGYPSNKYDWFERDLASVASRETSMHHIPR
ncbi:hypothetical protein EV363DRAFT_1512861 [Boletus edulis]|nr:hypothetical protein EV363DRAFT_1512861 [Boletus edulis]